MHTSTLGVVDMATAADSVVVFVGLTAAAIGVWWLTGVALWTVALRRPNPKAHSVANLLALPGARRLAQTLLARSMLVTSLVAVPACSTGASDADVPRLVWVDEKPTSSTGADVTGINPPTTPDTSTLAPSQPATTAPPTTAAATTQPQETTPLETTPLETTPQERTEPASDTAFVEPVISDQKPGATHVVREGEHLWSIASDHAGDQLGSAATTKEVVDYWRRLIELNRHRLFSGDPDLIHPGEVVLLA